MSRAQQLMSSVLPSSNSIVPLLFRQIAIYSYNGKLNKMSKRKYQKKRKNARELEFLLDCGSRGDHLLFSPNMIRRCFDHREKYLCDLFEKNFDKVQVILEDTLQIDSAVKRRQYIQELPDHLRNALIYGYFELIGGSILESGAAIH